MCGTSLGMLLIGLLIYALMPLGAEEHYYVEGVGYATVRATLTRAGSRSRGSCCCFTPASCSPPR